jgi:predicted nucleotidyltransferase
MGGVLDTRRTETKELFDRLQRDLSVDEKTAEKMCAYVTGSFGRGEASQYSDLDLFIVGLADENSSRLLSQIDETCLKADLIRTARKLSFPEFSGDGEYLVHYTDQELIESLGTRDDDAKNTLTARLLLLLESKPVIGPKVYDRIIRRVVGTYWRDYEANKNDFIPTFLANDILRLWRTFCVNYEASTASEPEEERPKRKLKNYKLRHSRLLTCYSTLLYLLTTYVDQKTVHPPGISFVKCSCGKLACSSGIIGAENLCPWCGRVGALARHGPLPVIGMKDR